MATSYPTIRKGSKVPEVKVWQSIIGVTADGNFGPATEAATKTWQRDHGLTADGVVGPKTWAAAIPSGSSAAPAKPSAASPIVKAVAAPAAPSGTMPTLRKGSKVPQVKIWQGIIGVTQDGNFGPATEAATKTWQRDHGLTADGVVGPKTWAAAQTAVPIAPLLSSTPQRVTFAPTAAPAPTFAPTPKPTTPSAPPAKKTAARPTTAAAAFKPSAGPTPDFAPPPPLISQTFAPDPKAVAAAGMTGKSEEWLNWAKLAGILTVVGGSIALIFKKLRA